MAVELAKIFAGVGQRIASLLTTGKPCGELRPAGPRYWVGKSLYAQTASRSSIATTPAEATQQQASDPQFVDGQVGLVGVLL